ncbi:winged helix-turn-helix transcriptional regulator, partial [Gilvimarinus sp. SDUM040013]|uniref:Lrp/AsnC family transcriptional regulator n=1 Tax=Gilvimarinus gilvus TaxID=3058038 RepID=UPI002671F312
MINFTKQNTLTTIKYRIEKNIIWMETLDQTDLELLRILQKDSKLTVKAIAALVNLSPSPVFERIKRLEQQGYIKNYRAVLDAEKLNKGF